MMTAFRIAFVLVFFVTQTYAAVGSGAQWEVRTTGASTNGGGFVSGAGTDYSQQDAAQYNFTDLASTNATTNPCVVTSASHNFVTADEGNVINITAGTSWTAGRYQIVSTAGNAATLDRACGSSASITGGTFYVGGAARDLSDIASSVTAGNRIWVKVGTYAKTATTTISVSGTSGLPVAWEGYSTTRGDKPGAGSRPVIQLGSTTLTAINITGALQRVRNIDIDCNAQNSSRGITIGGAQSELDNVHIYGDCKTHGISLAAAGLKVRNTSVTGASALPVTVASGQVVGMGVWAYGNTASGFSIANAAFVCYSCGSVNNTGATTDGVQSNGTSTASSVWWINGVAYGNGRDGIRATAAASADGLLVYNSVLVSNTGYGVNSATTDWSSRSVMLDHNAFYGNGTAARNGVPAGDSDVTLTGDPFVDGGSGNFALNSTAGAGAALKNAGWPGVLSYGGTGYMDIGPLQTQCTGGPATACAAPIMH